MKIRRDKTTKWKWTDGSRTLPAWLFRSVANAYARNKAERSRLARLKLGSHLLQDLGFTAQGTPLPQWRQPSACCKADG